MIKTDLKIKDFEKYFKANALGALGLPNLASIASIDCAKLYKAVTGWHVLDTEVSTDDIAAVIAFGPAVSYPGEKTVTIMKKRYGFFGSKIPVTEKVPIKMEVADFLVLTRKNLTREEYVHSIHEGDGEGGDILLEGGIHIVTKGIEQLIEGANQNDTVSVNAIKKGVPVLYEKKELEDVIQRSGIKRENPYKTYWRFNIKEDRLCGWVGDETGLKPIGDSVFKKLG